MADDIDAGEQNAALTEEALAAAPGAPPEAFAPSAAQEALPGGAPPRRGRRRRA
ncbi:hypothetical protein [Nocardia abscessus]|uniref:hypothetical protein n=1 Tax=Nocardia abscessus TaxID=120957 RepID=UPI002454B15A|nr:hypothetical protein [Nocardia abscessus]